MIIIIEPTRAIAMPRRRYISSLPGILYWVYISFRERRHFHIIRCQRPPMPFSLPLVATRPRRLLLLRRHIFISHFSYFHTIYIWRCHHWFALIWALSPIRFAFHIYICYLSWYESRPENTWFLPPQHTLVTAYFPFFPIIWQQSIIANRYFSILHIRWHLSRRHYIEYLFISDAVTRH